MDEAKQLLEQFEPQQYHVLTADPQVHAARFSPDGKLLAAGGFDGRVRMWDVTKEEPRELSALEGHHAWAQAIAFSPDGSMLFTSDSWGLLQAWDMTFGQPQLAWSLDSAHDGWIREVHVSPDGKRLVTCGRDQVVRVWTAIDGAFLFELRAHEHDVYCARFHPGGELIVSGDDHGGIKVWSASTGEFQRDIDAGVLFLYHRLQDVGGVRALAFDRDGKTLAAGGTIPKNGATVQGTPTVLLFDFDKEELQHTLNLGATSHCFVHEILLHDAGFVIAVTSGTPGQGQLLFRRPQDEQPFFLSTKLPNCHSLSLHEATGRLAVVATNRGSNGNGRRLDKDGKYPGNNSPVHLFQLPSRVG
jgi:WD40 repeat protein